MNTRNICTIATLLLATQAQCSVLERVRNQGLQGTTPAAKKETTPAATEEVTLQTLALRAEENARTDTSRRAMYDNICLTCGDEWHHMEEEVNSAQLDQDLGLFHKDTNAELEHSQEMIAKEVHQHKEDDRHEEESYDEASEQDEDASHEESGESRQNEEEGESRQHEEESEEDPNDPNREDPNDPNKEATTFLQVAETPQVAKAKKDNVPVAEAKVDADTEDDEAETAKEKEEWQELDDYEADENEEEGEDEDDEIERMVRNQE